MGGQQVKKKKVPTLSELAPALLVLTQKREELFYPGAESESVTTKQAIIVLKTYFFSP